MVSLYSGFFSLIFYTLALLNNRGFHGKRESSEQKEPGIRKQIEERK